MQYDGTMLITERIDECLSFYRHLLGAEPETGSGWASFTLSDGTMLALHTPWQPGMTSSGGSQVLLLGVESLTDETERLSLLDIRCSEPHEIPGGAVVTISDPDGRTIQLIEREH